MQTQCYLYSNSAQQQSSETHKQHFVMLVSYSRRRKEVFMCYYQSNLSGRRVDEKRPEFYLGSKVSDSLVRDDE